MAEQWTALGGGYFSKVDTPYFDRQVVAIRLIISISSIKE